MFVDGARRVGNNRGVLRLILLGVLVAVHPPRKTPTMTSFERILTPSHCGRARFGSTLAVSGPYLVIGATARDSREGVAQACLYDHVHWHLLAALSNTRTGEYAGFGDAIAVSSELGLVAANSPGYEIGDGPVHVFARARDWGKPRLLDNPEDPRHEGETYWADGLAFVGDDLAVGVALADITNPATSGAVLLYASAQGTPRVLRPSHAGHGSFGQALAADGNLLAVAAPTDQKVGRVYVFERAGSRYTELAQLVAPSPDERGQFGMALAVSGALVLVGSPSASGMQRAAGLVDVFERRGTTFVHLATIVSPDPRQDGYFGRSIACDGRRLAVGEPGGPGRRGRVWQFEIAAGSVRTLGAWEPRGLSDHEWFGSAVALGPDWIAAGAPSSTDTHRFGRVFVRNW